MADPRDIPFLGLEELEGATLADRFALDRMIGRGGYGAVFAATQISVDRPCAVKVLVPHVLEQPRNVRRFEREALATSKLAHPNTVVIYDFGLDDARQLLFLAMEFIEGESLRERIRRERRLDVETAVWIAHQAAGSLQDAHDRGLVHRDVKPHNIMVTDRGGEPDFVKVIDFGIARFLNDEAIRETFRRVTQTGVIIGTPSYMSPEQVRNGQVDGRSDQYSLAICVYQMLTGRTIFRGDSPVDIATKQLMSRPPALSELDPKLGTALDAVLLRALEKKSQHRFETIKHFAEALAVAAGVTVRGTISSAERRRQATEEPETVTMRVAVHQAEASTTQPVVGAPMDQVTRPAELAPVGDLSPPAPPEVASPRQAWKIASLPAVACLGALAMFAWLDPLAVVPDTRVSVTTPPAIATSPARGRPIKEVPLEPATETDAGNGLDVTLRVPAEPPPVRQPRAVAKPAHESGTITVTVMPWGSVVVDGKARGGTRTRQVIELPTGEHLVELRQDGERVASKTVDVQPGKNTMVKLIAR